MAQKILSFFSLRTSCHSATQHDEHGRRRFIPSTFLVFFREIPWSSFSQKGNAEVSDLPKGILHLPIYFLYLPKSFRFRWNLRSFQICFIRLSLSHIFMNDCFSFWFLLSFCFTTTATKYKYPPLFPPLSALFLFPSLPKSNLHIWSRFLFDIIWFERFTFDSEIFLSFAESDGTIELFSFLPMFSDNLFLSGLLLKLPDDNWYVSCDGNVILIISSLIENWT